MKPSEGRQSGEAAAPPVSALLPIHRRTKGRAGGNWPPRLPRRRRVHEVLSISLACPLTCVLLYRLVRVFRTFFQSLHVEKVRTYHRPRRRACVIEAGAQPGSSASRSPARVPPSARLARPSVCALRRKGIHLLSFLSLSKSRTLIHLFLSFLAAATNLPTQPPNA
jgi:hypothetical protein